MDTVDAVKSLSVLDSALSTRRLGTDAVPWTQCCYMLVWLRNQNKQPVTADFISTI